MGWIGGIDTHNLSVFAAEPGDKIFSKFLTSAGTSSLNTDGSTSSVTFSITTPVPVGIATVNLLLFDGAIDRGDFGGITGGLTNGVFFNITDENDVVLENFGSFPIKTNEAWSLLVGGGNIFVQEAKGVVDDAFQVHLDFTDFGTLLELKKDHSLNFVVRDDLTSITQYVGFVQGYNE